MFTPQCILSIVLRANSLNSKPHSSNVTQIILLWDDHSLLNNLKVLRNFKYINPLPQQYIVKLSHFSNIAVLC